MSAEVDVVLYPVANPAGLQTALTVILSNGQLAELLFEHGIDVSSVQQVGSMHILS